jgi:hypothetical protein
LRQLKHSPWDVEDILSMCRDAEHDGIDDYAQNFVDDTRNRVIRWGLAMALSEKQENFLMSAADKGLRARRSRGKT